MAVAEEVVMGSGKLYMELFEDGDTFTLADVAVEANQIGYVKGGASMEYTPSVYEVTDDLNVIYQKFVTKEAVKLKSGVMTWNNETLAKIAANGTYTTGSGIRTLKIGGNGARKMTKYALVFVHTKSNDEFIRVGIVGTKDTTLTIAFDPEKETVIDAEFSAVGSDSDGTLVIIEETVPVQSPQTP